MFEYFYADFKGYIENMPREEAIAELECMIEDRSCYDEYGLTEQEDYVAAATTLLEELEDELQD